MSQRQKVSSLQTEPPGRLKILNKIGARNRVANTRTGVRNVCVYGGQWVGFECALEPTLFPSMGSVLGGVLIPDGKRFVSSVNGSLAAAVRSPGDMLVSGNKRNKEVAINHLLVSLAHAYFGFSESYRAAAWNSSDGQIGSVFRVFASKVDPRSHPAPHDGTDTSANGTDQHRHCGILPGVPIGLTICYHVR